MTGQAFTSDGADATARGPSGVEDAQAHQHLERAYARTDAGELEDALRECDRAIEMIPEWAEAHNLRGLVLDEMGRVEEAIAAYEEAVRLDAGLVEAVENLAEAREERRGGRPKWKRVVGLVVPVVVLILAMAAVAVAEARRGPDWQLELEEYIAQSTLPSEVVTIQSVVGASEPQNFSAEMGRAVRDDWRWGSVAPSFPPKAVRCVLLERSRRSTVGGEEEAIHQVVFVAYHTDALYRVGWLAYAGPEAPLTQELAAHLATIGCDLGLE